MERRVKKFIIVIMIIVVLPYFITIQLLPKDVKVSGHVTSFQEKLDEYCIQRLSEEVSSDYEPEMLKVQAILVRTTVYQQVQEQGEDFSPEINSGKKMDSFWMQKLKKAWDATEGQVVMYNEKLALVPFHQVSNGKTRDGVEVLGSEEYSYIKSVECPSDVEAPNQMVSQFIEPLKIEIAKKDVTGYVLEIKVNDVLQTGEEFRENYNLNSSCFEVQHFQNQTRIITRGVGHGLGLSQYTANEMAKEGKTAEEILKTFFTDIEIKEVAEILWDIE